MTDREDARPLTDPTDEASATGLAGVPPAPQAGSASGVAGNPTFDPSVSPAHEGLAGSSTVDPLAAPDHEGLVGGAPLGDTSAEGLLGSPSVTAGEDDTPLRDDGATPYDVGAEQP